MNMKSKQYSGLQKDLLVFACLILLGLIIYSNNYQVTWYFDDSHNIIANENIYAFTDPLKILLLPRGPALLSFALNYWVHGETLFGYHLFNNLIHVTASCVVYLLLKRVSDGSRIFAFVGALIFLSHPIQTQAVTYIVQRMASLAAMFAFFSLYCFVRGREALAEGLLFASPRHICWYLSMSVFCLLAIMTKQNTAFLPVGMYVFGRYFLDSIQGWSRQRSVTYLSPFVVLPFVIAGPVLIIPMLRGVPLHEITSMGAGISPVRYFVSEWKVLLVYIRLLFVPFGQTLDYAYPLVSELLSVTTLLCGSILLALLYVAYRMRRSAKYVSFAIVWFFLSLAIESSFIPLDLLFEHRLYVPMFGFAVICTWLIWQIPKENFRMIIVTLLIVVYSLLTFQRNSLWANPIAFNEDNLRKAPHNERIYLNLSRLYMEAKRYQEAEKLLKVGLSINPRDGKLYDNLGTLYDLRGEQERAIGVFKQGITAEPGYEKLYLNLAIVYEFRSEYLQAQGLLQKAVSINPKYSAAFYNLGVVYYKMGNKGRALESFRAALVHAPYDTDAMYNIATTAFETGNLELGRSTLLRLKQMDRIRAAELEMHFH